MGSPTKLSTTKLYHPNAYGTAMAPLFMNLTFWIGAFMLVIIFLLEVDSEGIKGAQAVAALSGALSLVLHFSRWRKRSFAVLERSRSAFGQITFPLFSRRLRWRRLRT